MKPGTGAAVCAALLTLAAQTASAHPVEFHAGGFAAGLAHPFLGVDHVLAMIAMGVWAAQCGRTVLVPAFLAAIGLGGALAMIGVALPSLEAGVAATVLAIGLLIALAIRLRLSAGVPLALLFALWHGNAHGLAMPAMTDALAYTLGFIAASSMLLVAGFHAGGWVAARPLRARTFGTCVVAAGAMLLAG